MLRGWKLIKKSFSSTNVNYYDKWTNNGRLTTEFVRIEPKVKLLMTKATQRLENFAKKIYLGAIFLIYEAY